MNELIKGDICRYQGQTVTVQSSLENIISHGKSYLIELPDHTFVRAQAHLLTPLVEEEFQGSALSSLSLGKFQRQPSKKRTIP